jgi:hypothetical protein
MPAASPKALTAISRTVRRWSLHHRSDKSLQELAEMYNPCIRGWITYYSHFYKTRLRPTLKRIDTFVIRWARRKYKRMRSARMRPAHARWSGSETLLRFRSSAGYIIGTFESRFRKRQALLRGYRTARIL